MKSQELRNRAWPYYSVNQAMSRIYHDRFNEIFRAGGGGQSKQHSTQDGCATSLTILCMKQQIRAVMTTLTTGDGVLSVQRVQLGDAQAQTRLSYQEVVNRMYCSRAVVLFLWFNTDNGASNSCPRRDLGDDHK